MFRIIIICFPEDFILCCSGTLLKQIQKGHEVILLTIKKKNSSRHISKINELFNDNKLGQIEFLKDLDLSTITQDNVKKIQIFIDKFKPDMVIMPFNKAKNNKRKILGSSSILACRKISNIMMYEIQENSLFTPSIFFNISINYKRKLELCHGTITNKSKQHFSKLIKSLKIKNKISHNKTKSYEPYQSFRILLDSDIIRNF